jgi:transcriptional regulator GlxA family with amidase domain
MMALPTWSGRMTRRGVEPSQQLHIIELTEAYIESNWAQPVTVDDLTRVSAATGPELNSAFKKVRGCGPLALLNKVRLRHARQMLNEPEVWGETEMWRMCQFDSRARFFKSYGTEFGESPAQTLARARQRLKNAGLIPAA